MTTEPTYAARTSSRLTDCPPEVQSAVEAIRGRLSWASLNWGAEDLHEDALPHIAAAALDSADASLRMQYDASQGDLSDLLTEHRELREAIDALAVEWESDRDVCLAWLANPAMHVDPGHPMRLSAMADLLNRHAEALRVALAAPVAAPKGGA